MLIQRKVAQIIWGGNGGKPADFNTYWPTGINDEVSKKVWGSADEAAELRKRIEQAHGIKL